MKPTFKLTFEQVTKERYRLISQNGEAVTDFLPTWKKDGKGYKAGDKFIEFAKTLDSANYSKKYPFGFWLGYPNGSNDKHEKLSGVFFTELAPNQTFADSLNIKRDYAILVRFSDDWNILEMFFFAGMAKHSQELFKRWLADEEISETCVSDALPLKDEKAPKSKNDFRG